MDWNDATESRHGFDKVRRNLLLSTALLALYCLYPLRHDADPVALGYKIGLSEGPPLYALLLLIGFYCLWRYGQVLKALNGLGIENDLETYSLRVLSFACWTAAFFNPSFFRDGFRPNVEDAHLIKVNIGVPVYANMRGGPALVNLEGVFDNGKHGISVTTGSLPITQRQLRWAQGFAWFPFSVTSVRGTEFVLPVVLFACFSGWTFFKAL